MKHTRVSSQTCFTPVERDLTWLEWIARHGPQSSEFLFEATRGTHRCKDTALRRLQTLREAGLLRLPLQQRQIAKADFNPYVYDLTQGAVRLLKAEGRWHDHLRPTGHWWHGLWVSAVTGAIEIEVKRDGDEYIPARRILDLRGAQLAVSTKMGKLIPDQLFAIKSSDGYRAYMLEVDRGTEPVQSAAARKSLQRSLYQYAQVLRDGSARAHYGLRAPLTVLWVMNSKVRAVRVEEILQSQSKSLRKRVSMITVGGRFPRVENCCALI